VSTLKIGFSTNGVGGHGLEDRDRWCAFVNMVMNLYAP